MVIVNHSLKGIETVEYNDNKLRNCSDTIILVIDETTSDKLHDYYNLVVDLLVNNNNKLYLINVANKSSISKSLMMVMTSYRNYNIYEVNSKEIIDEAYVNCMINREPDISEVRQFVGGDISAYSEINTVIFGISDLVKNGDVEALKSFITKHYASIANSADVIDYLKRIADSYNSGEISNTISTLKETIEKLNNDKNNADQLIESTKQENRILVDQANNLMASLSAANNKVAELNDKISECDSSNNQNGVITSYYTVSTSSLKCKGTLILYFKEISQVRYINSLVNSLLEFIISTSGKNAKLMIYDSNVGIPSMYNGLSVLNTREYISNKDKIVSSAKRYVISEPNTMFIEDVLTSVKPKFDVVIIYDRMKQLNDIVAGANVHKIFVCNSVSNLNVAKASLKISKSDMIICGEPGLSDAYTIGTIDGYNDGTGSYKLSKYMKLPVSDSDSESIIIKLLNKIQ